MRKGYFPRPAFWLSAALCALVSVAVFLSPAARGQEDDAPVRRDLERVLTNFDQLSLDPEGVLKRARQEGSITLETSHGKFEMTLEHFDVRTSDYVGVVAGEGGVERPLERAPSNAYKGTVRGVAGSQVRFILDGSSVEGIIVTPSETFYIEPASRYSPSATKSDHTFYAESGVKNDDFGECGTTLAHEVGAEVGRMQASGAYTSSKDVTTESVFSPRLELRVATEADFEYFQFFGNEVNAQNEINSIMSMVSGIYQAEIGVEVRVSSSRVWNHAGDPYTETNASAALSQFRTTYNANPPAGASTRNLAHMWTGKTLTATDNNTEVPGVIGIAYTGVVCNVPSFGYGISMRRSDPSSKVVLTAHEMGHNFSARHPDEQTPPVSACASSIMNSRITSTTSFCQFSRDQITNHTAGFGSCLTQQVTPGCAYALSSSSQFFSADGGAGSVGVSAGAGCQWDMAEGASWLTATSGAPGSGPGSVNFNVAANTGGPRSALVDIAGRKLSVNQAASPNCGITLLNIGQSIGGELTATDCKAGQPDRPTASIDLYAFVGRKGQLVRIEMNAANPPSQQNPSGLDTYLYLFGPDGSIVAENDDIVLGQQTNSRIPSSGFFSLPATGIYIVESTSFDDDETGAYTLTLSNNAGAVNVNFSSAAYSVSEGVVSGIGADGTGFRTVTVTRTGDASGTVAVDYATSDGTASRLRDYTQSVGTLVFNPNETSKSFSIFVNDDTVAEGAETVTLTLSNPIGAVLGSTSTATLTINDNDSASSPSPVRPENFNTPFYVRQHYLDFFTREPDAPGLNFWTNEIESCGSNAACREDKRINVSAAFYLSIEFQQTGYLVYRFYKAAFGDLPGRPVPLRLAEFIPDTQRIGQGVVVGQGNWEAQIESNKNAFAEEFTIRPRFLAEFPVTMLPAAFVDALNARAGSVLTQAERDALVAELRNGQRTRAQVLRAVAENPELARREFNRAFVLMQYFGYLRRNPDDAPDGNFAGYNFWLGKLDQFGGNFIQAEMVKAFIVSGEYIGRFGP